MVDGYRKIYDKKGSGRFTVPEGIAPCGEHPVIWLSRLRREFKAMTRAEQEAVLAEEAEMNEKFPTNPPSKSKYEGIKLND